MKKHLLLLATVATLILAGCFVPSVNPLYTEKDLIFDPALVGTWGEAGNEDRHIFAREGEQAYLLTSQDKESTNVFRAHLLQLGKHRFLDVVLARTSDEWKGISRASVVVRPAHLFFKVEMDKSTLRLRALDVDWVEKLLKENPKAIAHERLHEPDVREEDNRAMLTASTAELQKFILKSVGEAKAFTEGDEWKRLESAPAK